MYKVLIASVLSLICFSLTAGDNQHRIVTSLNDAWRFYQGDISGNAVSSKNFSAWEIVSFPHTWNSRDAEDETPGFYRGTGWYVKEIYMPENQRNRQLYMYFEGANQETELFVNGKSAGKHAGGYTRFSFDITALVHPGKKNNFALKVSNRHQPDIPPLSADFTFFGGVYRDVYLINTAKQHISTTHFASSGVFISQKIISEEAASVSIKTILDNKACESSGTQLEHTIYDAKGNLVARSKMKLKIPAGVSKEINSDSIKISKPQLWSPENPYLYRVVTRLYEAATGSLLDEVSNPLGLRYFSFSADKGFILNGKPLKLIGTSRHQCYDGLGNALSDEIHVRDVKLLKEMGGNFLRISHYPQDPTVLEMCDKLGILCSVEIPVVNEITNNEAFTRNALHMAREMVMQDFNHPSVIIWAYMNEILLKLPAFKDKTEGTHYTNAVAALAGKLNTQIRNDDPSRYTMIAFHAGFDAYHNAGLTLIPDILGWNLYQGWYSGTFNGFGGFLDAASKKLPGKPFIVSEFGADADPRLHSFNPVRFDYTSEYAALYHEHYIRTIKNRCFVVGANIWNLNDFYSEDRANAVPHINNKGITTVSRELKDGYLFYRTVLRKDPLVSIGGMNWKIRGGNLDAQGVCNQPVKVYSNLSDVELFINGQSIGKKGVADNIAEFSVPFRHGVNRLEAVAAAGTGQYRDMLEIDFRGIPYLLRDSVSPFSEINVMLGSKRYFEDKQGSVIWIPEKEYTPGSWGYVGGKPYEKRTRFGIQPASDLDILGTTDDPVFQTQRINMEAFKMDVPAGKYTVSLYWAELQTNSGSKTQVYNLGNDALSDTLSERSFDVCINGREVINQLNLSKEYGDRRAVVRKFMVEVADKEGITISFRNVKGEAVLNAVRVYRNY